MFWGPSIHWNTYLEQYVMLLNRAKDDQFGQEGIYVSFSSTLHAAGLERSGEDHERRRLVSAGDRRRKRGTGTDRRAGRRARFFMTGRSERMIEFER